MRSIFSLPPFSRFILPASIALATAAVQAQSPVEELLVEEVLVTAELRDTPWLEQTASTSVIGQDLMSRRNALHLENLLPLAPNVNLSGGSSRARFYQVRGIGERSQFIEPLNPSVGLLIDDMDFSGLGTAASLFDMEQVEILRGPQGTLHGANALAGLINMRSAAPAAEASGRIRAGIGDYGRRELGASVTGPIVEDRLLYRLAAFTHRSDGFMDNAFLGRDDTNERDETLLRGRLRWLDGDRQQLDLIASHVDVDNGYDAFSLDNTRSTLSDEPGRDRQTSDALGVHYRRSGTSTQFEILANLADSDSEYSYDEDWSFVGIAPDLEYSSFDRYLRDRRSRSAQLRLSSASPLALAPGDLSWVAGAYVLNDEETLLREYTYQAEDFSSRFEALTIAAYGQLDLDFNEAWSLSAGLRLAQRDMDYDDSQAVQASPDEDLWGGKLALSYSDDALGMVYASISRGYRAGGVNGSILAFPDDGENSGALSARRFFDTEHLYNLELGHRRSFADGRVQHALTLFYMDRSDQQVRGSLVIPRSDGSTAFVDYTDNAASGSNVGLEWELRARAHETLELYMNLGLLRARFDDYINADGVDLSDRDQAHAPRYQFATGLSYYPTATLRADLQWEGRDSFYFSDRHDARSGSYTLVHARIAYEQPRWELALWARNLTDKDYEIRGFGSFGNDPRKGYIVEEYVQYGEPRQIGMSLELRF